MVKRRFTKPEIHKVLQQYEAGKSIQQIVEDFGISQATFYNWRAKYGSQSSSDLQNLTRLKEENDRLKRMYADLSLENMALRNQLEKRN